MMLQELAPCACGTTRYGCGGRCGGAAGSPFSLLFPVAGGQLGYYGEEGASQYGGGVPVDCTLSLGTPSTRRAEAGAHARGGGGGRQDDGGAAASCKESGREPTARRCANCDTTSTPLWRNGPRGPKSLCNACGIRYKKEERRAAAATQDTGLGPYAREHQQQPQWGCYGSGGAKLASFATYGDSAAADGPCLSWMLNVKPSSPAFAVRERPTPTLFQYC